MAKIKTPIQTNLKEGEKFQGITGTLNDEISRKDLLKNPEKYIRTHPTLFANEKEISHEVNTRFKLGKNSIGERSNVRRCRGPHGQEYAIVVGR